MLSAIRTVASNAAVSANRSPATGFGFTVGSKACANLASVCTAVAKAATCAGEEGWASKVASVVSNVAIAATSCTRNAKLHEPTLARICADSVTICWAGCTGGAVAVANFVQNGWSNTNCAPSITKYRLRGVAEPAGPGVFTSENDVVPGPLESPNSGW